MTLVDAREVGKTYRGDSGEQVILRDVTCAIAAGDRVAIIGASGSGKSTLVHILGGLVPPSTGVVTYRGTPLPYGDADAMARYRSRVVGLVFQFYHLLPELTALDNVALPRWIRGERDRSVRDAALGWLERLGVAHRADAYPATLSGGEQQRVAIARALIGAPELVLADEPTGNLDAAQGALVMDALMDACTAANAALVVVTHDPAIARLQTRTWHLREGHLHESV